MWYNFMVYCDKSKMYTLHLYENTSITTVVVIKTPK